MMNVYHKKLLQKLRQSERGSTAVEFALILPILASLVFGAIDFGRMLWFKEVLVNATRVGARQGTLFAAGNGQAEIEAAVTASLTAGGVDSSGLSVAVNGVGGAQGQPLNVVATIPWNYFVIDKLIPAISTPNLQASVTMMME
ncbi:TadE/TadG family type IV pilus assembly protein [Candidatus Nitrospira neomarina]|uniref:Pilus assembly protein n=1 Tax=Candidatus Nitrospira neomarina TaxID=3020899 RepID=A0AA96GHE5_9BACT|nr:TadE/TadG family type IV pilus assembly protein [Candidatus Nitrospira neomarina]WNM61941.1 pilus assembly protein [Candidatus Nitrospira neomarina]